MDKTLLKGLMVLEAVTDTENTSRTIDGLASRLGLTRSNMHRTLQTLEHAGYISRDEQDGGYRATIRLFEIGARQLKQLDVRREACAAMLSLAEETGETVLLSILNGFDVVYIDKVDGAHAIRAYCSLGDRAPAYAVATGKALLAYKPLEYVESHLGSFQKHTSKTIILAEKFKQELQKIRLQGYATNSGEWRADVGGVAVPIFDGLKQPVAALGISAPLKRLTVASMKRYIPIISKYAKGISQRMGCVGFEHESAA